MQKLLNLMERLVGKRRQATPTPTVATLQAEVERLKQSLALPTVKQPSSKAKTTELQKFMDLAG